VTEAYRRLAEAGWRWVLDQVRYDDGPWIPASVTDEPPAGPPWDRDGMHSGIGGLAHVLAEIRACRAWTDEEHALVAAIAGRLLAQVDQQTDATFFDGLVSTIGCLVALESPGLDDVVARLLELAQPDGWAQTTITGPRYREGARINDLTLGTAGVLLGAVWAHRHDARRAADLATRAADVLLAEAELLPTGTSWPFVPERFVADGPLAQMPNLSHGVAGVATALAVAGADLGRPDLVQVAGEGARHLVSLADQADGGFLVARTIPPNSDQDEFTFTWCHGPTGTSLLFRALAYAGVAGVEGATPATWQQRCLQSVRTSGVPERLRPGFWDNDGRCCGTAGAGEVFLDSWHHGGDPDDLAFARHLADALVERAVVEGPRAWWRFIEHRNEDPMLPPGVGWMQGAAGIAAYLFHLSRVVEDEPHAPPVPRIDNWWAL
jgi:hypothetical protein